MQFCAKIGILSVGEFSRGCDDEELQTLQVSVCQNDPCHCVVIHDHGSLLLGTQPLRLRDHLCILNDLLTQHANRVTAWEEHYTLYEMTR